MGTIDGTRSSTRGQLWLAGSPLNLLIYVPRELGTAQPYPGSALRSQLSGNCFRSPSTIASCLDPSSGHLSEYIALLTAHDLTTRPPLRFERTWPSP